MNVLLNNILLLLLLLLLNRILFLIKIIKKIYYCYLVKLFPDIILKNFP